MPGFRRAVLSLLLAGCPGDGGTPDATTSAASDASGDAPTGAPTEAGTGPGGSTGPAASTGTTDAGTDTGESTGASTTGTGTDASTGDTDVSTGMAGACTPGATEACYGGDPATRGVGLCASGERSCDDRGAWGPCVGEVLPDVERCEQPGDEDCDGVDACAGAGEFQWSRIFGAAGNESGLRVAIDGAGNIVLAAHGTSTIDLGGGPLTSAGGYDLFLARLAPDGEHLWSKRFGDGSPQVDHAFALAVDAAGQIAVAGDFAGVVDFGGGPLVATTNGDPFLARFTPDGAHVWSRAFACESAVSADAVAFDAAGAVVLGGSFGDSLDLGGVPLVSGGNHDVFLGKFAADGAHVWSRRFGADEGQYLRALATDADGDIVVVGDFRGELDLGDGPLVSAGDSDVFVARLDPDGGAVWSERFGDFTVQAPSALTVDGAGRITLTGRTLGEIDLGGGPLGGNLTFIAQLDGDGAHLWSRALSEGTGAMAVHGITHDGLDALALTGDFTGSHDFGGGPLVATDMILPDVFVVKLGPGGQHVWSRRFGDGQYQVGRGIAAAADGRVVVTGRVKGSIDFGGGPASSNGGEDGFVVGLGP